MPWTQAHLIVPKDKTDQAEETFEALGAVSITLGDAKDEPVLETLPDEIRLWSLVKVTALFEFGQVADDEIRQAVNMGFSPVSNPVSNRDINQGISQQLSIETLKDQDWERAWMDHFKPMQFGNNLWICPTGQTVDMHGATIIDLDPGLAFGTGTHPTTAMCLEWLDQHPPVDRTVIDYGCGSGILAIAALKLGASHAVGIDYDPQALSASKDNAEKNHVENRLQLLDTNQLVNNPVIDNQADLLLANILAGVLVELVDTITALVKPGGQIVLSGILSDQAEQVLSVYKNHFDMQPVVSQHDWVRLEGTRINNAITH